MIVAARSIMKVPGWGMPALRPVAAVLRRPHASMVFEPASDSSGNVIWCLSAKAFSVSIESYEIAASP